MYNGVSLDQYISFLNGKIHTLRSMVIDLENVEITNLDLDNDSVSHNEFVDHIYEAKKQEAHEQIKIANTLLVQARLLKKNGFTTWDEKADAFLLRRLDQQRGL